MAAILKALRLGNKSGRDSITKEIPLLGLTGDGTHVEEHELKEMSIEISQRSDLLTEKPHRSPIPISTIRPKQDRSINTIRTKQDKDAAEFLSSVRDDYCLQSEIKRILSNYDVKASNVASEIELPVQHITGGVIPLAHVSPDVGLCQRQILQTRMKGEEISS